MFDQIRDLDFQDLGGASQGAKTFLLGFIVVIIAAAGWFLLIDEKTEQLEVVEIQEQQLRSEFEDKQEKAANLEAYEQQLEDMQELLQTMFRQLPSKTEMDKLLVDVSQTALGAGIDVQLFEPLAEQPREFYAERPISIRMMGNYHQFGDFVSGVASLPRVVILTMHDISLRRAQGTGGARGRRIREGQGKTDRYIDEEEAAAMATPEVAP